MFAEDLFTGSDRNIPSIIVECMKEIDEMASLSCIQRLLFALGQLYMYMYLKAPIPEEIYETART